MNEISNLLLGALSIVGTFFVLFALFYFLLKYSICKIFNLKRFIAFNKLFCDDLVSIIGSLLILISFVQIHSPY